MLKEGQGSPEEGEASEEKRDKFLVVPEKVHFGRRDAQLFHPSPNVSREKVTQKNRGKIGRDSKQRSKKRKIGGGGRDCEL